MSALVTRHEATTSGDKGRIKVLVPYPFGPGKEALAELERKFGHARAMEIMEEYANSEVPAERVIAWGSGNMIGSTPAAMAREMFDLAAAARGNDHRKSVDPHEHLVISFERSDVVTKEDIERAIQLAMAELGMQEHMFVYAAHDDTDNIHAHLIFSRVDPVTLKHIKIEFPVIKAEMIGARINHELGLAPMQGNRYRVNPETNEVELMEQQAVKQVLLFDDILTTSNSWAEFHSRTRRIGINYSKRGSGALINDVKASEVDRAASLSKLVARWGTYEPPAAELLEQIEQLQPSILSFDAIKSLTTTTTAKANHGNYKAPKPSKIPDAVKARNGSTGRMRELSKCNLAANGGKQGADLLHFDTRPNRHEVAALRRDISAKAGGCLTFLQIKAIEKELPFKAKPAQVQRAIDREQARQDLAAKQKLERDEAYKKIKADKQALYKQMKRIDYRVQQSLQMIAADDGRKILADLRLQQKIERQRLAQFLNQRLPRLEEDEEVQPGFIGNLSEEELEQFNAKTPIAMLSIQDYDDLARYTARREVINGETIYKYCQTFGITDFIDHGNRISLLSKNDDAVLAALKLAQIKFGNKGIEVNGSDKFKAQVKRLAALHDINLSGEMAQEIEIEKVRITKERESIMQTEYRQYTMLKQIAEALHVQYWTPTWKDYDPAKAYQKKNKETGELLYKEDGTPKMKQPGASYNHKDGIKLSKTSSELKSSCTTEQMKDLMERIIRHQNNRTIGVIVRPYSTTHHIVHIDDVSAEKLKQIEDPNNQFGGLTTSVVITTSTDNRNVILICEKDQSLDEETNHSIGVELSKMLNSECGWGDKDVSNSAQPFRLPGLLNKKPKHMRADGTYPEITLDKCESNLCPNLKAITVQIRDKYLKEQAEKDAIKQAKAERIMANAEQIASIQNSDFAKSDASKLYVASVQKFIKKVEAGGMPQNYYYVNRHGEITNKADLTRIDIAVSTDMLLTQFTPDDLYNAMVLHSNAIKAEYDPQQKKGAAKVQAYTAFVINNAMKKQSDYNSRSHIETCFAFEESLGIESPLAKRIKLQNIRIELERQAAMKRNANNNPLFQNKRKTKHELG